MPWVFSGCTVILISRTEEDEMTTTTTTLYTTLTHAYPTEIDCAKPAACTNQTHWEPADEQYDDVKDARYSATNLHDAPAIRILRKVTVVTEATEVVETVDAAWTAEEIAAAR
jgi:hypothetical protein